MASVLPEIVNPYDHNNMEIDKWLTDLDNAIVALYGDEVSDARKRACLSTFIGTEGKTVINNLAADKKDTYPHLVEGLTEHYKEAINVTVERHKFNNMSQDQGELIEQYVTKLSTQANKCKFIVKHQNTYTDTQNPPQQHEVEIEVDISDQFIRDRLVCGMHNQQTRAKLLRERNLTLQSAIEIIKAVETANTHVKKLFSDQKAVDKIYKKQFSKSKPQLKCNSSDESIGLKTKGGTCGRCRGKSMQESDVQLTTQFATSVILKDVLLNNVGPISEKYTSSTKKAPQALATTPTAILCLWNC